MKERKISMMDKRKLRIKEKKREIKQKLDG